MLYRSKFNSMIDGLGVINRRGAFAKEMCAAAISDGKKSGISPRAAAIDTTVDFLMQRLHDAEAHGDKERIAKYEKHCTSVLDCAQNWGPEWHEKVKELMWQRYKLHDGL